MWQSSPPFACPSWPSAPSSGCALPPGYRVSLVFVGFSALWGLAFTCFPYAVALKTGSPAAVNACYVVFFPLFFLTDAVVPKQLLTGWFSVIATYNPVTYLLGALRSLITSGWQIRPLLEGLAAVAGLALVGISLALAALRARIRMGD